MWGTQAEGNVDKSKYLYNLQPVHKCMRQVEHDSLLETFNCLKGKTTFAYQQPGLQRPVSLLEQMKALSGTSFCLFLPQRHSRSPATSHSPRAALSAQRSWPPASRTPPFCTEVMSRVLSGLSAPDPTFPSIRDDCRAL